MSDEPRRFYGPKVPPGTILVGDWIELPHQWWVKFVMRVVNGNDCADDYHIAGVQIKGGCIEFFIAQETFIVTEQPWYHAVITEF